LVLVVTLAGGSVLPFGSVGSSSTSYAAISIFLNIDEQLRDPLIPPHSLIGTADAARVSSWCEYASSVHRDYFVDSSICATVATLEAVSSADYSLDSTTRRSGFDDTSCALQLHVAFKTRVDV
jgi:hypothetical protein